MKEEHSSTCRTVGGVFVLDRMTGTCRLCGHKVELGALDRIDALETQLAEMSKAVLQLVQEVHALNPGVRWNCDLGAIGPKNIPRAPAK